MVYVIRAVPVGRGSTLRVELETRRAAVRVIRSRAAREDKLSSGSGRTVMILEPSADWRPRNPITGVAPCCALAASGQAVAPTSPAINSRRRIRHLPGRYGGSLPWAWFNGNGSPTLPARPARAPHAGLAMCERPPPGVVYPDNLDLPQCRLRRRPDLGKSGPGEPRSEDFLTGQPGKAPTSVDAAPPGA
jgi:hypothetical protein